MPLTAAELEAQFDDLRLWGRRFLLAALLVSLPVAEASAQTFEGAQGRQDPSHMLRAKDYVARAGTLRRSGYILKRAMKASFSGAQHYYLHSQANEIAAVADVGEEVEVYLLYVVSQPPMNVFGDMLVEVSPHPFPPFLSTPDRRYRKGSMVVTGTGRYLSLGMPKYDGFIKHRRLRPGETVMRARQTTPELLRQGRAWDAYKAQRDTWKRENAERIERARKRAGTPLKLPLEIHDLDVPTLQVIPPPDPDQGKRLKRRLRDFARELDQVIQNINELEYKYRTEFLIQHPNHPSRNVIRRLLRELRREGVLLEREYLLVVQLSDRAGIGITSFATFDDWTLRSRAVLGRTGKFHVEQKLEAKARERRWARLRQSQREKLERPAVLKRRAWEYLKDVVAVACADPNGYARMDRQGRLIGIEFTAADFEFHYAPDRAVVWGLADLLSVRPKKTLNSCQRYVLGAIQRHGGPVSPSGIVAQVQRYREENPTFWKSLQLAAEQLAAGLDAFVTDFGNLSTYTPSGGSSYSSPGDGYEQAYDQRESRGIRGGVGTVQLNRPLFDGGFGSTLGQ